MLRFLLSVLIMTFIICFTFIKLFLLAFAQYLQAAGGGELPLRFDRSNNVLASGTPAQAIVPTYTFNCCANITRWETIVEPGRRGRNEDYTIAFQVWRPSASDSECYKQVNQNLFSNVVLEGSGEVNEEVSPSEYIAVEPGDVVGFYVASQNGGDEGIQLEQSANFMDNVVWFAEAVSIFQLSGTCPFRLGDLSRGQLTMSVTGAPMLRVGLCKFYSSFY